MYHSNRKLMYRYMPVRDKMEIFAHEVFAAMDMKRFNIQALTLAVLRTTRNSPSALKRCQVEFSAQPLATLLW